MHSEPGASTNGTAAQVVVCVSKRAVVCRSVTARLRVPALDSLSSIGVVAEPTTVSGKATDMEDIVKVAGVALPIAVPLAASSGATTGTAPAPTANCTDAALTPGVAGAN